MITNLRLTLVALFFSASLFAQNAQLDFLADSLKTLKGEERIPVLGDLSWGLAGIDIKRSVEYGEELMKLSNQTKDSTKIADAANVLSVAYYRAGDYQKALSTNHIAYKIRKAKGEPRAIGSSLNKYVNIYSDQVKLDSALFYGLESLKMFEQAGDSGAIAQTYNALASIYQKDRNWEKSMEVAKKGYAISERIGFVYAMGGAAGNVAICLQEMGKPEEAIEWYEEARKNFETVGSLVDLSNVNLNLGVVYRSQGEYQKAYDVYKQSLEISEKTGEAAGIMVANANMGAILLKLSRASEAIPYFLKAKEMADREMIGRTRLQVYSGLSEAYALVGKGEESANMLTRYIEIRDSLYNEDRAELLAEMQTKFDVEKKDQENAFLKQQNALEQQQKIRIIIGSVVLIVLLIIAGYFYYLGRKRRQETEHQEELVKEREKGLEAVFDATEEERKRIAKDLHDGIGQQLSGLKLSWESVLGNIQEEEKKSQLKTLTEVLDEACVEVRNISHQMMPKALMEKGLVPAIEDMLRKSLSVTSINYRFEHFKVDNERFNERVEVGVYRICQELVNNIIKHSGATEVVVQLYRNKNSLIMIVEDNGKGFDAKQNRDGIGMMNISSRLSTVSGEVLWEPGPNTGAVATVRIPIK